MEKINCMNKDEYIKAKSDILEYELRNLELFYCRVDVENEKDPAKISPEYFCELAELIDFCVRLRNDGRQFTPVLITPIEFAENWLPF
jgi:hypothetical protein